MLRPWSRHGGCSAHQMLKPAMILWDMRNSLKDPKAVIFCDRQRLAGSSKGSRCRVRLLVAWSYCSLSWAMG